MALVHDGWFTHSHSLSEQLECAHDLGREHRPAWRAFNERARRARGDVGIWHVTFLARAGAHESVYMSVPVTGLPAATSHVPVGPGSDPASERLALAS